MAIEPLHANLRCVACGSTGTTSNATLNVSEMNERARKAPVAIELLLSAKCVVGCHLSGEEGSGASWSPKSIWNGYFQSLQDYNSIEYKRTTPDAAKTSPDISGEGKIVKLSSKLLYDHAKIWLMEYSIQCVPI